MNSYQTQANSAKIDKSKNLKNHKRELKEESIRVRNKGITKSLMVPAELNCVMGPVAQPG